MGEFDFTIGMAGLNITIQPKYQEIYRICRPYLVEADSVDMTVSASMEEIGNEMVAANARVFAEDCEAICIYRNICMQLPAFDALLIHGAAVAVDNEAYVFLAHSGVGKTTHIRLWQEVFGDRAQVVNGDKPILRRFDGQWCVCGTPWRGKEKLGGKQIVPLKALCFLERGEENKLLPLPRRQAVERILHQLLMPREEKMMTRFLELLDDLLRIPSYILYCDRTMDAARTAYHGINKAGQYAPLVI